MGDEGDPIQLAGSGDDAGDNDDAQLTYQWSAVTTGIDGGGQCTFDDATAQNAKVTCTDDGAFKVRLVVSDDDGGTSTTSEAALTVANAAPVADAGGPYTGNEGAAVSLDGDVADAGSNDTHTWSWEYVAGAGVDAGASCDISDPSAEDPTITCTDDGTIELTLLVTDDDGDSDTDVATLTLSNVDPVADAGGDYTGDEGASVQLSGSKSDAGSNDTHTKLWSWSAVSGVDAGASCSFSPGATALSPSVSCTDDGIYQLTLTVTDDDGGEGTSTAALTLDNVAPAISALTKPDNTALPGTILVAGTLDIRTTFADDGSNDTHTAAIECETGAGFSSLGGVTSPFDTGCTFGTVGTKTVSVRVTDDDGNSHVAAHTLTVKYNFDGFSAPVDRPNTMNLSKAGQAIPLKWRLTDATGAPVTDLVAVSVQAVNLGCSLGNTSDLIEEYAAGASGLQNLGNGYYQFNWKTPAGYASSCKSVKLVFGAGALSYTEGPLAYFSFKK